MFLVATTPFSGLLGLFFAVPLGIVCSIYGAECISSLRHRHERRPDTASQPIDRRR